MKIVNVERQIIEAHVIYNCYECRWFKEYGAAYQDGNSCEHDNFPNADITTIPYNGIHENCPIAMENPV